MTWSNSSIEKLIFPYFCTKFELGGTVLFLFNIFVIICGQTTLLHCGQTTLLIFYFRVGGEENFFHCSRCDMCLGIQLKDSHKVRNNNLRCLLKWICAIILNSVGHKSHQSSYIFLYLFTWYQNKMSFLPKAFWNELILVFIPNKILVLVKNHVKQKLCSGLFMANGVVWGRWWPCRHIWFGAEATRAIPKVESINFLMWMQYKLHSGRKVIAVSYNHFISRKQMEQNVCRWNEVIPEWKSLWYHVNSPWLALIPWLIFHVLSLLQVTLTSVFV